MNKHAIYIFTCHRPIELRRLLLELQSVSKTYDIYIIDDSSNKEIIELNRRISDRYCSNIYLGKKQYLDFYNINIKAHNCQVLGDKTWNLGMARNFALDHATLFGHEKVLFVDDDISGVNKKVLKEGFETLKGNCFVSCTLKGVEDDSIVGHIAKKAGLLNISKKMLSGGFLFLSPLSLSHRFYNIYNEDWILQLLENKMGKIVLPYDIYHGVNQKFEWTLDKALFQELGELIIDGLFINYQGISMDYSFWDNVLENRKKFIQKINLSSQQLLNHQSHIICIGISNWLNQFNGQSLKKTIEEKTSEYIFSKVMKSN